MAQLVGQSLTRTEDVRFLTGRGRYVDDLEFPHLAHAVVLRSPVAHGIIRAVDTTEACAQPGVLAILTAADLAQNLPTIPMRMAPLPDLDRFVQPVIAADKVRYVGEPIGVIVAETRHQAEDAVSFVQMEIDPLPAIVDHASAAEAAALLFETHGSNVASHYRVASGDVAAAFAAAEYTRREHFRCHRHSGIPMETRGVVALWHPEEARLQVWGAAKVAFANRQILAKMMGLPETAIDMIEVDIGGGFGVRGEFYPEDFLIPFVARRLGRPVKWIEDRREHFIAANHSRDVDCDLEIACRRDGTILALRGHVAADMGAYARTTGGIVTANAARNLPGPYHIADFACTVEAVLTNKTPVGTYRAPGQYESGFFRERLIDIAAADLGIDPAEMRRRNLLPGSAMPSNRGKLVPYTESDTVYDTGDFHVALERALDEIGWEALKGMPRVDADGWYRGVGLSCFVASSGVGPKETASIVLRDGGIDLHVGASTMGQGHETVFAQICGDALGLPLEQIRVMHGSTTHLKEGWGTYHSRATVMAGSAVLDAAAKFIDRLRPLASAALGHPNTEVAWRDGCFMSGDDGGASLPLRDLLKTGGAGDEPVVADGSFSTTKRTYTFGTHAAHVAVDPATGRVRLIDYVAVEDIGRIINPLLAQGQALGAVVQGLGGALLEELVYDENGQLLAGTLADYLLPSSPDFAAIRCICLEDAPSPSNPLGVKGGGEGAIVPVAGAIANAIAAALAPLGAAVLELPLSPPRLWRMIEEAKAAPPGPKGARS